MMRTTKTMMMMIFKVLYLLRKIIFIIYSFCFEFWLKIDPFVVWLYVGATAEFSPNLGTPLPLANHLSFPVFISEQSCIK